MKTIQTRTRAQLKLGEAEMRGFRESHLSCSSSIFIQQR